MEIVFLGVTVAAAGAAAGIVALLTRNRPSRNRSLLAALAAVIVGGAAIAARPAIELHYFNTNEDYAWSQIRTEILKHYPPVADMFALDATIEPDLRRHLVPVFRAHRANTGDPSTLQDVAKATMAVIRSKIVLVAVKGTDEAIVAWGDKTVPTLQAFKNVSPDACADYAIDGVNRVSNNPTLDAALSDGQRAVIAAYRSSKPDNKMPTEEELGAAYEQARTLAEPPFGEADLRAFQDLKNQPKARQCDMMLRLFAAIDRLPVKQKAAIYRSIMAES
jgi:hypothetical protein